ncbi:MAG: squalene/phytoene synthase family protein [Candidatus Saccharibacteria bacterium]
MNTEKWQVERAVFVETRRLLARDRKKYLGMVMGLYCCGFLNGVTADDARVTRAGYFFARHIDDALDGENTDYDGGQALLNQLPLKVSELESSEHKIAPLGRYAMRGLIARQRAGDQPANDMQRLIDSMTLDYERSRSAKLFNNEDQLTKYYGDAMRGTNIMLIGFNSKLREDKDFNANGNGLGRVYSARDLQDDWERQMFNIPRDSLDDMGIDLTDENSMPTYEQLIKSDNFKTWQIDQLSLARQELNQTIEMANSIGKNDAGAIVVKSIATKALGYIPGTEKNLGL